MSFASLHRASPVSPQSGALSGRSQPDLDVEVPDPVVRIDRRGDSILQQLSERAPPDLNVEVPDPVVRIDRRQAVAHGA